MPQSSRSRLTLLSLFLAACSPPAAAPAVSEAAPAERKSARAGELAAASGRSDLPVELSADDLREVLDPAKIAARQTCNGMSRTRERIEVELTIAGSSGAVSHTNIGLNGGNPELASCVANELGRSNFKTTQKAVTRTTVAVNF